MGRQVLLPLHGAVLGCLVRLWTCCWHCSWHQKLESPQLLESWVVCPAVLILQPALCHCNCCDSFRSYTAQNHFPAQPLALLVVQASPATSNRRAVSNVKLAHAQGPMTAQMCCDVLCCAVLLLVLLLC